MAKYINISGRRYLVTGASSGIGRELAIQLAARGASVVITGRDAARLEDTLSEMVPGEHVSIIAGLNEQAGINSLVDQCGAIDGVVHCAGIQRLIPLKLLNEKILAELMDANFKSAILLTQRLVAKSKLNASASVVLLSSIAAHTGTAGVLPYSAAKGAIEGAMRPMAIELAIKKIRVNSLAPAIVRTPIFPEEMAPWLDDQEKKYPLGLGQAIDVANAAIFLLSDASRFMTGSTIVMDGGCTFI